MSRYEAHTSTLNRAGFYLPFSGANISVDCPTFMQLAGRYDYVPLCARFRLEDLIPGNSSESITLAMAGLFQTLKPAPPSCFLESLTGSDNGRYSIIASQSLHCINTSQSDMQGVKPLRDFINSVQVPHLDFPFFSGGLIGFWSYETGLKYHNLPVPANDSLEQSLFMPGEILVYDRHEETLTIILWIEKSDANQKEYLRASRRVDELARLAAVHGRQEIPVSIIHRDISSPQDFTTSLSSEEFCRLVRAAQQRIRQGDIFQVVLSRRWKYKSPASPWQVYQQLRGINPSPYMFYLLLPEQILMGASPEMQVKVEKNRILSRPIAGTRKVSGNVQEDESISRELLADEKEKAEHLMLVDLSRNDIGRVSCSASVAVREFMKVEAYSHVAHIVSTVEGRLRPEVDALGAFESCFPAGTLSGAPKRKAMEIIAELEKEPRGPYGGSLGFVGFNGWLDSCITIRSILYKNETYYLQSGAGIVADSIPEREDEETYHKARVLMVAIKEAERYCAVND